jgi:phosphopentomutase
MRDEWKVGRVIARPYVGKKRGEFRRTSNRRDYALKPSGPTALDALKGAGLDVIGVGKIRDIFDGEGLTAYHKSQSSLHGMDQTIALSGEDFRGLCFVNLVDFDMLYGHRRDAGGYAEALNAFDAWLPSFLAKLREDDLLLITADHGCDPGYQKTTDHTREYVPLLALGKRVHPADLGTRVCFADVAATVAELLGAALETPGKSFVKEIM